MQTNRFFIVVFCLMSTISFAQDVVRIEIGGNIIVNRNDLEGVTVYNTSSNKGTVTDKEGYFILEVALNDRVEFAALQFKNFVITVTQDIINAKAMTVLLVEQVNKLPEVVILPHNLTGNLVTDVNSIELVNPNLDALYFGLGNLDKIEFSDDHLSGITNIAMPQNNLIYGINVVNVVGLLLNQIFPSKNKIEFVPVYKKQGIFDVYDKEYLKAALNIVEKDLVEFVYYVEEDNFDFALLDLNREFEFLEFLKLQAQKFVAIKYGKD